MSIINSILPFLSLSLLLADSSATTSGYEIGYKIGHFIGANLHLLLIIGILLTGLTIFMVFKKDREKSKTI
ncbi:hypothetical protein [Pararhodonellum marinum]|uniref:hypothetical protein n=1 Tax=Pararhodonellum marinum TaxID=2755358 RepID=UPI00188DFEB1|nr:hypothetical protein [Pararhodonellum marinum]